MRLLRDLGYAFGFLTVLPVGREWPDGGAPDASGFYPWVGWALGAVAVLVALACRALAGPADLTLLVGAALVLAAWALLTRMLHWDGLADTVDGLWGASTAERRLEIMRDSRVGSFGVTAVVLLALLQVSSLGAVLANGRLWVLVVAPVLGRAAIPVAAWTQPAARRDGLGLSVVRRPSLYAVAVAGLAVFGLLVLGHLTAPAPAFFGTLALGVLAALAVPRLLARPVGGMTGDLFGATVLIVETVVLLGGALLP